MKVYVSADIEGISGVVDREDTTIGGREYERARRLMTAEVNAVVAGAFEAGATQVLVNDAHAKMRNLIVEDLDPGVEVIQGAVKRGCMMEGLDESFDAVFFLGYHSRAGDPFGVLNHTMWSGGFHNLQLNGEPAGEIAVNAAYAGQMGVPVALVTGDQTAVEEAKELLGDVESAVVKEALGRYTAKLLHPSAGRERVRLAARLAVERVMDFKPYVIETPATMGIEFTSSAMADVCSWIPTVEKVSPRSVRFEFNDWRQGMGLMLALLWLAIHVATDMESVTGDSRLR
jgi:D-amino peptidase